LFVEITMRDPSGEPVGYGVAQLDVDAFVESGGEFLNFSDARSSAKPDEEWMLPPGYQWTLDISLGAIMSDYAARRHMRDHDRWRFLHGVFTIATGIGLLMIEWPGGASAAFISGGIGGLAITFGVYVIGQTLVSRRRRR
jgi:hypothetical protein